MGPLAISQSQFRINSSASTEHCKILTEQILFHDFNILHTSLVYKMYGHMQLLGIHIHRIELKN